MPCAPCALEATPWCSQAATSQAQSQKVTEIVPTKDGRLVLGTRTVPLQVIVSYHNYEATPPREELLAMVETCFAMGADVAKMAPPPALAPPPPPLCPS